MAVKGSAKSENYWCGTDQEHNSYHSVNESIDSQHCQDWEISWSLHSSSLSSSLSAPLHTAHQ